MSKNSKYQPASSTAKKTNQRSKRQGEQPIDSGPARDQTSSSLLTGRGSKIIIDLDAVTTSPSGSTRHDRSSVLESTEPSSFLRHSSTRSPQPFTIIQVDGPVSRPRGRPRIHPVRTPGPRGRPRIHPPQDPALKRPVGRPRKYGLDGTFMSPSPVPRIANSEHGIYPQPTPPIRHATAPIPQVFLDLTSDPVGTSKHAENAARHFTEPPLLADPKATQLSQRNCADADTLLEDLPSLYHRHDALRTRLLSTGLWYEDVDRLIHDCEEDEKDANSSLESESTLMPPDSEPLSFRRAVQLLSSFDFFTTETNDHVSFEQLDEDEVEEEGDEEWSSAETIQTSSSKHRPRTPSPTNSLHHPINISSPVSLETTGLPHHLGHNDAAQLSRKVDSHSSSFRSEPFKDCQIVDDTRVQNNKQPWTLSPFSAQDDHRAESTAPSVYQVAGPSNLGYKDDSPIRIMSSPPRNVRLGSVVDQTIIHHGRSSPYPSTESQNRQMSIPSLDFEALSQPRHSDTRSRRSSPVFTNRADPLPTAQSRDISPNSDLATNLSTNLGSTTEMMEPQSNSGRLPSVQASDHQTQQKPFRPSKPFYVPDMLNRRLDRNLPGGSSTMSLYRDKIDDELRLWKTWKGASNDVMHAAWSNDGTQYAVGASALVDTHTMQYNRPNNLLLGSTVTNTLAELPNHYTPRPPAPGSSTLDPRIFQSISAIQWSRSESGNRLYTAGYDKSIRIWDTKDPLNVRQVRAIPHRNKIMDIAVSTPSYQFLASGTDDASDGFRIFKYEEATNNLTGTVIDVANLLPPTRRPSQYSTSSLRFGPSSSSQDYLAIGLTMEKPENDLSISIDGFLGLWRLTPSAFTPCKLLPCSQNVFDISWHPTLPFFATASTAPLAERKKNTVRSLVRVYDTRQKSRLIEYDCPAADLNVVTFCPTDFNYITASATDGITYVWDYRRPDQILHKLCHGKPLPELAHDQPREMADVGVRVALWGNSSSRFYTGSSDGVLKEWDIRRTTSDTLTRDVVSLEAEVMSGAFSPDGSDLVLGDAAGGVHLLSKAPLDDTDLEFISKTEPSSTSLTDANDEGRKAAVDLVSTGQIEIVPGWGAGKGRNYRGPWAKWATPEDRRELRAVRRKRKRASEDVSSRASSPNEPIMISDDEYDHDSLSQARTSSKRQKKSRRSRQPRGGPSSQRQKHPIRLESNQPIDLTLSDDEASEVVEPIRSTSRAQTIDSIETDDSCRGVEDDKWSNVSSSDEWFPPNWMVDANIRAEEV